MKKSHIIAIIIAVGLFITAGILARYNEPMDYYDHIPNPITPYIG